MPHPSAVSGMVWIIALAFYAIFIAPKIIAVGDHMLFCPGGNPVDEAFRPLCLPATPSR